MIKAYLALFLSPLAAHFAAAIAGYEWIDSFVQIGVAGGVLLWFMIRNENRMKSMEFSVDRMAKAQLLVLIANDAATALAKQHAQAMITELDQKGER